MNDNLNSADRSVAGDYEESGFSLNLGDLRAMAKRQRFTFIGAILLALLLGFLVTFLQTPQYESTASVRFDLRSRTLVKDGEIEERLRGAEVGRYLQSQVELVQSRNLARRVIDDLQLAANDDFLVDMNLEPIIEGAVGEDMQTARLDQVRRALLNNIEVALPFNSSVMTITFTSPSRETAVRVANAYADNLISGNIEQRFESSSYARNFLAKEIEDAKTKLEESEREVLEYANESSIIDASDGVSTTDGDSTPRSITTTNLIAVNSATSEAKTERIRAEERWRQAQRTPLLQLPEVLANPAIQNLQAERSRQINRREELGGRYGPEHPLYQEASGQIATMDAQIQRLARQVREGIRGEYQIARNQEASLNRSLNQLKSETVAEQRKRIQLNLLGREVDTDQALYESLLERFKQVSAQADAATNDISVLDRAEAAEQVSPRPIINMLLALFSGLALGFLFAFMRETFDDSVRSPDDVGRKLGLPMVGTTPTYDTSLSVLEALRDRTSPIAEAYASIRTSLDFSTNKGVPGSLLVTSSQPSEGKSTSSIAISEGYAKSGKRVLLVDADLRRPSLHGYLGAKNKEGFVALLTGKSSLEEEVQAIEGAKFQFLSSGPIPPDPAGIIMATEIARFIEQHQDKFDLIVFDGPPVMGLADSPQIASAAEGTVMVVESGRVQGGKTKSALRRLRDAKANVVGVLLSKFDVKQSGYGDAYGYSYEYGRDPAAKQSWFSRVLGRSS